MAKRSSPNETLSGNSRNNGVEWVTRLLCQHWSDKPASISWDAHSLFIQTRRSNTQLWIWVTLFKRLPLPFTFVSKSAKCKSTNSRRSLMQCLLIQFSSSYLVFHSYLWYNKETEEGPILELHPPIAIASEILLSVNRFIFCTCTLGRG